MPEYDILNMIPCLNKLLIFYIYSSKSELGFVFHQVIEVVVDQAEALRSTTTESSLHAIDQNILGISFIFLGKDVLKLVIRDIGSSRMNDFQDLWVVIRLGESNSYGVDALTIYLLAKSLLSKNFLALMMMAPSDMFSYFFCFE